jgi:uncharacterized delta-60 repeat protein
MRKTVGFMMLMVCMVALDQGVHGQSIDITFNPGSGLNTAPATIALYTDGRILVAGGFSQYNGNMRRGLARLQSDGTLDGSFDPMEGPNGPVRWVFPQPDGKLIIAGDFSTFNSLPTRFVTRLRPDGSVDLTFPTISLDGSLQGAISQGDGRIMLAGSFTHINGTEQPNFARLNTNGTLDGSFSVPSGVVGTVDGLTALASGKTLVFGSFSSIGSYPISLLARLDEHGVVDTNFALPFVNGSEITAVAEQPDGRIVICGEFTSIDGYSRIRVARLNSEGTLDLSFYTPLGIDSRPYAVSLTPDGRVLLGGNFYFVSGVPQLFMAQLKSDGTLASTFNPRFDSGVTGIRSLADGNILACGGFTMVNGTNINRIVRLTGGTASAPGTVSLFARPYPAVFVQAATGTTYRIEFVTSLTNSAMWTPLTNLLLLESPYLLLDTTWTNSRQRFYRALELR